VTQTTENTREKTRGPTKKKTGGRKMRKGSSNNNRKLKTTEPETTLLDEGRFLRILTELPGISEEEIKVDLENHSTSITIHASDTVKQYKKVITVPCEVRVSKKRFSDGVLEINLEKTTPTTI
jgi:HSP20 family molecular chaperone IbpA